MIHYTVSNNILISGESSSSIRTITIKQYPNGGWWMGGLESCRLHLYRFPPVAVVLVYYLRVF